MNKLRDKKSIVFLSIFMIAILVMGISYFSYTSETEEEIYQISYIHRKSTLDESQQSIKQGIGQAATDYNFELKDVAFDRDTLYFEQMAIIEKEVENGADAILVEAIDKEEVYTLLKEINKSVPVVLVNGEVAEETNGLICVNADYYDMGYEFGTYIGSREENKKISVLLDTTEFADKDQMVKGMCDALNAAEKEITMVSIATEESMGDVLNDFALGKYLTDAFVVFDADDLEYIGKKKEDVNALRQIDLYGFEKSNKIITYLESDIVDGLVVSNEYSIGYLCGENAVKMLNHISVKNQQVEYRIIDATQIYTVENQRLLFPFLQ